MDAFHTFISDLPVTSERTNEASVHISKLGPTSRDNFLSKYNQERRSEAIKKQEKKASDLLRTKSRLEKTENIAEPIQTRGFIRKNSEEKSSTKTINQNKNLRINSNTITRLNQKDFILVKKRTTDLTLNPAKLFDQKVGRQTGCKPAAVPEHVKVQNQNFNDYYGVELKTQTLQLAIDEEPPRASLQFAEEEPVALVSKKTAVHSNPSDFPFPQEETNTQLQPSDFSLFRRKLVKKRFSTNFALFARGRQPGKAEDFTLLRPDSGVSHQSMMECNGAKEQGKLLQFRRSASLAGQFLSSSIARPGDSDRKRGEGQVSKAAVLRVKRKGNKKELNERETRMKHHSYTDVPRLLACTQFRPFDQLVRFNYPICQMHHQTFFNADPIARLRDYSSYWMKVIFELCGCFDLTLNSADPKYYLLLRDHLLAPDLLHIEVSEQQSSVARSKLLQTLLRMYQKISTDLHFEHLELDPDPDSEAFEQTGLWDLPAAGLAFAPPKPTPAGKQAKKKQEPTGFRETVHEIALWQAELSTASER